MNGYTPTSTVQHIAVPLATADAADHDQLSHPIPEGKTDAAIGKEIAKHGTQRHDKDKKRDRLAQAVHELFTTNFSSKRIPKNAIWRYAKTRQGNQAGGEASLAASRARKWGLAASTFRTLGFTSIALAPFAPPVAAGAIVFGVLSQLCSATGILHGEVGEADGKKTAHFDSALRLLTAEVRNLNDLFKLNMSQEEIHAFARTQALEFVNNFSERIDYGRIGYGVHSHSFQKNY